MDRRGLLGSLVLLVGCSGEPASTPMPGPASAPVVVAGPAPEIAAGPAPEWSLKLAEEPEALLVAADGTVLAIVEDRLVGVRDGAITWRSADTVGGWALELPGAAAPTVLVRRGEQIVAVDPATGSERWAVAVPQPRPVDEDGYVEKIRPAIVALVGDGRVLVGDSEARFFYLRPEQCGAQGLPARECLTPAGQLTDETLDEDAHLLIDGEGRRVLAEFGVVRLFDGEWNPLMVARAHDYLGPVALAGDGLALLIDGDVVMLAPAHCGGVEEFAPSGFPQPGQLHVKSLDGCPACAAPPPDCRRWRRFVDEVAYESPVVLADGTVIVNADGETLALQRGEQVWTQATGGGGPLLRVGEQVIGLSTGLADADPLTVFALGSDGAPRWRSPLALDIPGSIYFSDDLVLAHGGGRLVVAYRETMFALPLAE